MHSFNEVVEKCLETGLSVGFVPGFPGEHVQGESVDEQQANLRAVVMWWSGPLETTIRAMFIFTTPRAGFWDGLISKPWSDLKTGLRRLNWCC